MMFVSKRLKENVRRNSQKTESHSVSIVNLSNSIGELRGDVKELKERHVPPERDKVINALMLRIQELEDDRNEQTMIIKNTKDKQKSLAAHGRINNIDNLLKELRKIRNA